MKPIFHPKLVNDPLGDPGLLIQFLYERRSILFDLGDLSQVSNGELLKVSDVFVSHTHIDHFVGFDQLLRLVFGRGRTLRMYGPENFLDNIEGKLRGFTWNLVDRYSESITIEGVEVRPDHVRKARFRAVDRFQRTEEHREPFVDNILLEEPAFTIYGSILEHRVPCLGFALKERFHVNIRKDRLVELSFSPGSWLTQLKQSVFSGEPDDTLVSVPLTGNGSSSFRQIRLGDLKRDLVLVAPGQKIAYVVDTVFNESNKKNIVELVRDADIFYCESPFIAEEEERARERCHLTSRQAGLLAREAGARQLRIFHFSPKHTFRTAQLYQEAREAFEGTEEPVPDSLRH